MITHYNFCRIHQTLRVTAAMEAGIADHVWTLEEVVGLLDSDSVRAVASSGGNVMATVACVCISEFCNHKSGERCGKPVRVRLKSSVALGESRFSPEVETGICEECWATMRKLLPWLFV